MMVGATWVAATDSVAWGDTGAMREGAGATVREDKEKVGIRETVAATMAVATAVEAAA